VPAHPRRRTAAIALGLTAALVAACQDSSAGARGPDGPPPPLVALAPARGGTLTVDHAYLGEVRALARAVLSAGAEGEVRDVRVREGDRVSAGDLLVRVDPDLAAADVAAAAAARARVAEEAAQAARDAERFAAAGTNAVAATEIERAASQAATLEAERRNRRAQLAAARESRRRHDVRAPFDGVVARRRVDPGAWVSAGDPVVELVADTGVEILVTVPPAVAGRLAVGDGASLRPAGDGDRGPATMGAPATIGGIVPAVDPATRTVTIRIQPNDRAGAGDTDDAAPPRRLLPGDTVDAVLTIERNEPGSVVVPRDALVQGAVETRVVRLDDEGRAAFVTVEVLASNADEAMVRGSGLSPGTELVVRGNERLRPEQDVRIAPGSADEDTGG